MAWQDCVYLVRIQANDGYSIGTGFLVASDILLTVAHVIPIGSVEGVVVQLIRPIDPLVAKAAEDMNSIQSGKVIWRDYDSDVAAVFVESSKATEWIGFTAGLPKGILDVVTRGFPEGARVDGERTATPVSGVLHRASSVETYHTLEVSIPVKDLDDWAGYSGAPVIDPATGLAVGILVRAREAFSGTQYLEALTVDFLFGLPDFLNCFRSDEHRIFEAVRRSRICALVASGQTIAQIAQSNAHKDWFMADSKVLCDLGLMEQSSGHNLLPVTLKLIKHQKDSTGFSYLT